MRWSDGDSAALAGHPGLVASRSKPTYLEIANAACSKGDGLRALAGELGIDVADTVFFGDNHNDVSAFAVAGTAVAVSNAVEPALDAASVVTGHHREDGVAVYLEEWLARTDGTPSPTRRNNSARAEESGVGWPDPPPATPPGRSNPGRGPDPPPQLHRGGGIRVGGPDPRATTPPGRRNAGRGA